MKIDEYLERIDYHGPRTPDLECLGAIHQQHLLQIAYKNLDVQLGRPLDFDIDRIFDKIVRRRRGGWCYEMNGLLGWALEELDFDVMRMSGGDEMLGNHLVLAVQLDQTYIADVGLGNGMIEPTPLREGKFSQGFREFELSRLKDGHWRFRNFPGAMPLDFDFAFVRSDESVLAACCEKLQKDPESMFRQNLLCMRLHPEGARFLLGRILFTFSGVEPTRRVLESPDELSDVLTRVFDLEDFEIARLWPRVLARHEEILSAVESPSG
jgi:N-hydroxyarylamine O-acetyltransferase